MMNLHYTANNSHCLFTLHVPNGDFIADRTARELIEWVREADQNYL